MTTYILRSASVLAYMYLDYGMCVQAFFATAAIRLLYYA